MHDLIVMVAATSSIFTWYHPPFEGGQRGSIYDPSSLPVRLPWTGGSSQSPIGGLPHWLLLPLFPVAASNLAPGVSPFLVFSLHLPHIYKWSLYWTLHITLFECAFCFPTGLWLVRPDPRALGTKQEPMPGSRHMSRICTMISIIHSFIIHSFIHSFDSLPETRPGDTAS